MTPWEFLLFYNDSSFRIYASPFCLLLLQLVGDNQLLFTDDTELVANSKEKWCRLVSEFGRVCEKKKV